MLSIQSLRAAVVGASLLLPALSAAQPQPGADPVGLRGDISGTWFNPAQPGHGLGIELFAPGKAAISWYTFDHDGAPMWLVGVASTGTASLHAEVSTLAGGRFPPMFDPTLVQGTPWGELQVVFSGCGVAELSWNPEVDGFEPGSMPLQQLTGIDGLRCNSAEEFAETRIWSFERGTLGFQPLFADLPPGEDTFYELDFAYEMLPDPLQFRRGLRLSGNNHSDDLAMLVTFPVRGLQPNTVHRIEMDLELASNVPTGCSGVGGSPGDSVYIKLGTSTQQPLSSSEGQPDGWLRLNFDYGQQSQGGAHVAVVGTLANSYDCEDGTTSPWELRQLDTRGQPLRGVSDANGVLWVVAGSDSAFEGRSDWYLTRLQLRLDPVESLPSR